MCFIICNNFVKEIKTFRRCLTTLQQKNISTFLQKKIILKMFKFYTFVRLIYLFASRGNRVFTYIFVTLLLIEHIFFDELNFLLFIYKIKHSLIRGCLIKPVIYFLELSLKL